MNKETHINKSTKFWIKYSLFILAVIGIVALVLRANDTAYEGLENYVLNNNDIYSYAGEVKSFQVLNTRYVSETDYSNRYNEYKVSIVGTNKSATLKIRAEYLGNDYGWKYTVIQTYDS